MLKDGRSWGDRKNYYFSCKIIKDAEFFHEHNIYDQKWMLNQI
jgi:hypothetical protein